MPASVRDLGKISVIIPAYNARRVLQSTLTEVSAFLSANASAYEIIVVDDGSTDSTAEIADAFRPSLTLLKLSQNRGKGHAVKHGMLHSTGDWSIFMDADNSTSITHLTRFAEKTDSADVLIASRRLPSARIVRPQHRIRQALGRTFPYIVRLIALPNVSDTQCGFKMFSRAARQAIFPLQKIDRFAFDVELLLIARKLNLRLAEIPVNWDNPTSSTVRIHIDTIQMLCDVLRARWRLRNLSPATRPSDS
ncbi:MAG TPA: dolichyl-phosphate beta-glucosyltransferase [Phycisphaerales bacterium]|nr:dolichyl-phosphate beta-glucosyltransferase [Phycisphaerales bacterium]